MEFGSQEVTNAILTFMTVVCGRWGWAMDKRLTILETKHEQHHNEKASL